MKLSVVRKHRMRHWCNGSRVVKVCVRLRGSELMESLDGGPR